MDEGKDRSKLLTIINLGDQCKVARLDKPKRDILKSYIREIIQNIKNNYQKELQGFDINKKDDFEKLSNSVQCVMLILTNENHGRMKKLIPLVYDKNLIHNYWYNLRDQTQFSIINEVIISNW